jgi:hypothetical protein
MDNDQQWGEVVKTIAERLKAVEDKQDEVIHLLQAAGGQLQKIADNKSMSVEEKVRTALMIAGGQLRSIKPREENGN